MKTKKMELKTQIDTICRVIMSFFQGISGSTIKSLMETKYEFWNCWSTKLPNLVFGYQLQGLNKLNADVCSPSIFLS